MTGKADFTEEEWELVREGPPTAGMVALIASRGGSFQESWALAETYAEARKEHGESELLDALVAESPEVRRYNSAKEAEEQGLSRLGEAVELLQARASPGEVRGYQRFTLDVAARVAEAHKEGEAMVSSEERDAIEKIAARLYPAPPA
jgi:hypothetical protein